MRKLELSQKGSHCSKLPREISSKQGQASFHAKSQLPNGIASGPLEESCIKAKLTGRDSEKSDRNVVFLGQEWNPEEYKTACQNLSNYFSILARWAEKAKQDEKKAVH